MKLIIVSKSLSNEVDNVIVNASLSEVYNPPATFHLIFPQESKYKIDEIKSFNSKLSRKNIDNESETVYVIMKGDSLSDIAQNALLKTLEESLYSVFIVVSNVDSLLPTIKSRCNIQYFERSSKDNDETVNQNLNDKTEGNELPISYESIPKLSKMDREEVIAVLESFLSNQDVSTPERIIFIHEAIRKLKSNCKIESLMFELVHKLHN